ncbi:MAG: biopolymer transporter ExbD [Burkholderiaceae bacterium]|nr:biopolymer transporter ExbD [Burkholderiaceae bacterium]MBR5458848.1 biopolymer transporter ExbD [Burkholderiaceae bacterium]
MDGLRSSRRSSRRRLMADINVVPYIDVMLVLVVILMVAAPFVNPSLVNLPSVKKAEKAPDTIIEVIVHPTGAMSVRKGKDLLAVDMPGLIAAVKNAQNGAKEVPVVIAADKVVQYEQVVNVMKSLQDAQIQRVGLSLKVEK